MTGGSLADPTLESVESLLRDGLAHGDAELSTAAPVLRHLLVHSDNALFSDEVVARARGFLADMALQLLRSQGEALDADDPVSFAAEHQDDLALALAEERPLLAHVHALAVEGTIALQLEARSGIDPVLCPLLEELVASRDDAVAGTATAVLAAQARFILHHRRMSLPLGELPGELFHRALLVLQGQFRGRGDAAAMAARNLSGQFDEGHGRLALVARLVGRMNEPADRFDIRHAGLATFASALAAASAQDRDLCVLWLSDGRFVRLALAMRAAGLTQQQAEKQLLHLDVDFALPEGFGTLGRERAALLLGASHGE